MPRIHHERFASRGIRTGSPPDAMAPGEFPYLANLRQYTPTELTARAGHVLKFATAAHPVANIGSYGTEPIPRYVALVAGAAYLDTGAVVDSGYAPAAIQSMLPFRPAQSPASWMYVADAQQYHKLSSPGPGVAVANAGIVEPQAPPGVVALDYAVTFTSAGLNFVDPKQNWHASGTASTPVGNNGPIDWRTDDIAYSVWPDPVSGSGVYTIQCSGTQQYTREQLIVSLDSGAFARVQDVYQPIPAGISLQAIQYATGTTGLCTVVPRLQVSGPGDNEQSLFTQQVTANLRRGALVEFSGGSEIAYVLDVETGPDGSMCFTTSTTGTHTTAETLSGVPAIQAFLSSPGAGNPFYSSDWYFTVGTGIGSIQFTGWAPNFFIANGGSFQPDDYISFSVNINDLTKLTELKLIIDVSGAGSPNFTDNYYFYAVRPSDIAAGTQNLLTQLGVAQLYQQRQQIAQESAIGVSASKQTSPGDSQWSVISVPLREFVRIGNDLTKTLNDADGMQFLFNCSGTINAAISSITIHGGGQVDVGMAGRPYAYRIRPRASATGVRGNPSPATRYAVSPRRQVVLVRVPAAVDPQQDLWDVFRLGGTLDVWRKVGETAPSSVFVDDFSDSAVASEVLPFDDLQPWPTVDVPLSVMSGVTVVGTQVTFTLGAGSPQLATIPRYLPGNQVRITSPLTSTSTTYTLWTRPIVTGTTATMQLVENAGAITGGALFIYEPQMASQQLPFLWGPDAFGTVFGVGDANRPGTVQYAKEFNPDSVPSRYNTEVCAPSVPLTGGTLRGDESWCCNNQSWWALRASFSGPTRYTPRLVEGLPGAVSHFAICDAGFVAKDGVYDFRGKRLSGSHDKVYTLFPHEGAPGQPWPVNAAGATLYPPNYELAAQFRLTSGNGFMYFDYPDTNGGMSHLVYDIHGDAWYPDTFAGPNLTMHYVVPQKDAATQTFVVAGDAAGNVLTETPGTTDNGSPLAIACVTRELCPGGWAYAWFEDPGLDIQPTLAQPTYIQATALGGIYGTSTALSSLTRIPQAIVQSGGGSPHKSQGMLIRAQQTYTGGELPLTLYLMQWVAVPYPEPVLAQVTKATSHGLRGFQHLYQGQLAYQSTGPVLLTFTFDQPLTGPSLPSETVTLPATLVLAPAPQKQMFKLPPNKFKLVTYGIQSIAVPPAPVYVWDRDTELWVREWGSAGPYRIVRPFGDADAPPIA